LETGPAAKEGVAALRRACGRPKGEESGGKGQASKFRAAPGPFHKVECFRGFGGLILRNFRERFLPVSPL
jgi:hypothetical protein